MLCAPVTLYLFLSFSMPSTLIKSYIAQAQSRHAVIVFRGIDPHVSLKQFLMQKLAPLLNTSSTNVDIRIDPLLFERFHVKIAPTFVYTLHCKSRLAKKPPSSIQSSQWIKLSGAVTTQWAVDKLLEEGAAYESR